MDVKFKKLEWKHKMGTRETARPAFGIELYVWDYKDICMWSIGDAHDTIKRGRCKTKEQAKLKAEIAFIEYLYENLAKCLEESK